MQWKQFRLLELLRENLFYVFSCQKTLGLIFTGITLKIQPMRRGESAVLYIELVWISRSVQQMTRSFYEANDIIHTTSNVQSDILTRLGHRLDGDALLQGHEAQHGEDGEARHEAGEAVEQAEQEGVPAHTHTHTHTHTQLHTRVVIWCYGPGCTH